VRTPPPYLQNKQGESVTRDFVLRFLERVCIPGDNSRPFLDSLYGKPDSLIALQNNYYVDKPRNPLGWTPPGNPLADPCQYIGRADRVPVMSHSNEAMWCLKADFTLASTKLDKQTRIALGLKYVADLTDDFIAHKMKLAVWEVEGLISAGITRIANILDRKEK